MARPGVTVSLIRRLSTLVDYEEFVFHSCAVRLCTSKFVADMCKYWVAATHNPGKSDYEYYYDEYMGDIAHGTSFAMIIGDNLYKLHVRGKPIIFYNESRLVIRGNFKLKCDALRFHLRIGNYSYKIPRLLSLVDNSVEMIVKNYPVSGYMYIPVIVRGMFEADGPYDIATRVLKTNDYFRHENYRPVKVNENLIEFPL